jgi:four helix bundle protein
VAIVFWQMFITLNHQKLDVYKASIKLTVECYRFTNSLPTEERFSMVSQIRRAALSVHLNIAEGSSQYSKSERKRFYEIARGSLIEIDAAFDIADELGYFNNYSKIDLEKAMNDSFGLTTGLINSQST